MKILLGLMMLLTFSTQVFASADVSVSVKDMPKLIQGLRLFGVSTSLYQNNDLLTLRTAADDGKVYNLNIRRHVLKSMQMDTASFMSLLTSNNTDVIVMCLEAEIVDNVYFCTRLALNANVKLQ